MDMDAEEEEDDEDEEAIAKFKEGSEDEDPVPYDDEIYDEVHGMPTRKKVFTSLKGKHSNIIDEFSLEVDMEKFMEGEYDEEAMDEEEALEEYRKTFGQGSNLDVISEKPSDEADASGSKHESPADLQKKKTPDEKKGGKPAQAIKDAYED